MSAKWLCFDTENDSPLLPGIGDYSAEEVRRHINFVGKQERDKPIQMICAVVYDFEVDRLHEFRMSRPDEKAGLLKLMRKAKGLVSHSGHACDLTIMEETYGMEALALLRRTSFPHYDLYDPNNMASLETLARRHLSAKHYAALDQQFRARIAEADERWPEFRPGMRPSEWREEAKLAKAVMDVKMTAAVYRARQAQQKEATDKR